MDTPTEQPLPGLAPIARVTLSEYLMPDGKPSHWEVTSYAPDGRLIAHWAIGYLGTYDQAARRLAALEEYRRQHAAAQQELRESYEPTETPERP